MKNLSTSFFSPTFFSSTVGAVLLFLQAGVLTQSLEAQTIPTVTLPRPDTGGWIQIYRGNNKSDFSVYTGNGSPAQEAGNNPFGGTFSTMSGDTIVTTGQPNGQLIFKQVFSYYIMEVQLRWPGNVYNTGSMEKVQWNDQGQGGGLPTCIECQGDPNQGIGQVWCLGANGARPWITFHGKPDAAHGADADSTQPVMDFGGAGGLNCVVGFPGWQKPFPSTVNSHGWVTMRTEVHGKDTTRHFVDGVKVMEYLNPRIAHTNDANNIIKTLNEGMITVQSEGGPVWYRGWRIKLLPQDPLYASLYTTSVFKPRDDSRSQSALRFGFDGTTLSILSKGVSSDLTGRRIIDLPKVIRATP